MGYIKGQNLRLFIGTKCVAAATTCSLHTAAATEDTSTKDSTADWAESEITGLSWDASCESLIVDTADTAANTLSDIWSTYTAKKAVAIKVQTANSTQNRTASNVIVFSGNAIITDLSVSAQNKQNATLSISLTGIGELTATVTLPAASQQAGQAQG